MSKLEELKKIFGGVLRKVGVEDATINTIFTEGSDLSDEVKTGLSSSIEGLTTLQAAEADQSLRDNVLRDTLGDMENKLYGMAEAFVHLDVPKEKLDKAWQRKHLTEKVKGIFELIDVEKKGLTPDDMVPKSKFEAAQHKIGELEKKVKSGGEAWKGIIEEKDSEITKWKSAHDKALENHSAEIAKRDKKDRNRQLLGHIDGKLVGKGWQLSSAKEEILRRFDQKGKTTETEQGELILSSHDDTPIYGENKTKRLTPHQLIEQIASEMGVLDKGGSGGGQGSGGGAPHVPNTGNRSSANGSGHGKNYGGREMTATQAERASANDDQFKKMGLKS